MPSEAQNGAAPSRSSSPEYNPVVFQAFLDESVSEARALVNSWLPKNLGAEWDSAPAQRNGSDALQSLKDRARPPRLGLGAQPASLHKQLAEDRKIAARLLRGRNPAMGDDGANVSSTSAADEPEESDDEEDSRARAVGKGKARAATNGAVPGTGAHANPFVMPAASTSRANGTPTKAPSHGAKPLFNDPSPAKAAPRPTSNGLMAPIKASSSFYGGADAATAQPLTKNQRKKERERIKREEERRRREAESRAEAAREELGGDPGAAGKKRARDADGAEEVEDDAVEDADASVASPPPSPSKVGDAEGGGDTPSKKKRRKKKKTGGDGVAAGVGDGAAPLLNLAPLAKER